MSEHQDKVELDEIMEGIVRSVVIADALPQKRAAFIASTVYTLGILDENSRKVLTNERPKFPARQLLSWDRIGAARAAISVLGERMFPADFAIGALLKTCFEHARYKDFIDTDEIITLVGASYAAGIVTRRQFPRVARTWVERRIAA